MAKLPEINGCNPRSCRARLTPQGFHCPRVLRLFPSLYDRLSSLSYQDFLIIPVIRRLQESPSESSGPSAFKRERTHTRGPAQPAVRLPPRKPSERGRRSSLALRDSAPHDPLESGLPSAKTRRFPGDILKQYRGFPFRLWTSLLGMHYFIQIVQPTSTSPH